ncbi:MAG: Co2+/Mg2+ efflux protein ApaG [Aquisalimonadaceae bacterium]
MSDDKPYNVEVDVEPSYVDHESNPEDSRYVFSYTVTIRNVGQVPVRLISRHWIITDANGEEREVHGEGVVGEQPFLDPGKGFRYTSGAMLETPVGSMHGSYEMLTNDGVAFTAEIRPFTLARPHMLH